LSDYRYSKENESKVSGIQFQDAKEHIDLGTEYILISDTNLSQTTRDDWYRFATENGVTYKEIPFHIELHKAIKRNIKRNYSIPDYVIKEQYKKFRKYLGLDVYTQDYTLPRAVIFDIDGTIADNRYMRSPYDWDSVHLDRPYNDIIDMVNMYYHSEYEIILVSGRDEVCRNQTIEWLNNNDVSFDKLYMREHNSRKPDTEIKEDIFWDKIANNYSVEYVFDDRQRMVDHWRSMGLRCLQVQEGDF
jgi:hypothetical protein